MSDVVMEVGELRESVLDQRAADRRANVETDGLERWRPDITQQIVSHFHAVCVEVEH